MAKPPKKEEADQNKRRDEALMSALRMPPKPFTPKPKPKRKPKKAKD